jgi:RNA polymerase sigma factor for flagellar operon FliA
MTTSPHRAEGSEDAGEGGAEEEYERLVCDHLPLVHHLVRETLTRVPAHVTGDDLTSAGMAALVQAAHAFEPERGVKFATFASPRIRGAILDELRSLDWASRSVRRRARQLDAAREAITSQEGRDATDHELAAHTGLSLPEVRANRAGVARAAVLSLQGFGDASIDEIVPGRGPSPEQLIETRERVALLVDAIACLPHRLRTVVEDYFFAERPMSEIAADLGVTESRVSQMRAEALERLRGALDHVLEESPTRVLSSRRLPGGVAERRTKDYYDAVANRRTVSARLTSVS